MRVAIVEDDKMTNEYIKSLIEKEGWETESFYSGEDFLKTVDQTGFTCVILDINLKLMDGFDVLFFLKKYPEKYGLIKSLILTSKNDQEDVNRGLRMGADDYLRKPFNDEEFILRLNSLLIKNSNIDFNRISYKNIIFNFSQCNAIYDHEKIKLSKNEIRILEYFLTNIGLVVPREKLYYAVWEEEYFPGNKKLEICISRLKKKFPILSDYLVSYRGTGYKLEE